MRALSRATLDRNTASPSLEALGFDGLSALCRASAARHAPDVVGSLDPRLQLPIAYSEARATRLREPFESCAVCESRTCPAADIVALPGDDLAWLTPNLYPILLPPADDGAHDGRSGPARDAPPRPHDGNGRALQAPAGLPLHGLHLVHWSSLRHDGGLVGADGETAAALFAQLARAEEFLLHRSGAAYPASGTGSDGLPHRGHAGLIKNRGRRVGGSVEHDHQQLLLSNQPYAEPPLSRGLRGQLLAGASAALRVDDVDGLARTLVPPFMRRPLHAFVVPTGADAGWLHHLPPDVLDACALAVARLTHAVTAAMEAAGQEPAWNLICLSGEGCGPVFELRAFTQPLGGYEHLGLYLCEELPQTSAARLREALPR